MKISEIFGSKVFNDNIMKARLPKDTYYALKKTISEGKPLDVTIANTVANAMKDWAIENGCTHYTHWFQPMTGITAEKHESFIAPQGESDIIMEFSGKELIKGEPDASSFPTGGLRSTFEARGYTAWDPTSYAFIKEDTLCIPTAFCTYNGAALDKKTPLLRSMEAVNKQALRILRLFGNTKVKRVLTTVGAEQEYFLISKELYDKRADLVITGRTLFGARPPKGQELEDHYFGVLKRKVKEYMADLDNELWKLGIQVKTEHNETAPAQHELAPIFETTNIACDHNQLTMEIMKKVAEKHGLVCLLHEKPFAGVSGSGKHNNWSLCTDTGVNLLNPGNTPHENAQFLLFLCAVIKAVDEYQDLLRMTVASAGNDHRLGSNEAPPDIVSMFLGEELTDILEALAEDIPYLGKDKKTLKIGAHVLPSFSRDATDRNRTSPFAFTGNKFEFRMLGSALSISCPNTILNTIVAEELSLFADELENTTDFTTSIHELVKKTYKEHKRIIFNGNNYSPEWLLEARKRGLEEYRTTPEALPVYIKQKNINLFVKHNIYKQTELISRYEILIDNYSKVISIEALTMIDMVKKEIIPAVCTYSKVLTDNVLAKKQISKTLNCDLEETLLQKISMLSGSLIKKVETLEQACLHAKENKEPLCNALFYKDNVLPAMNELRAVCDELETVTGKNYWPFPTYTDLMFSV